MKSKWLGKEKFGPGVLQVYDDEGHLISSNEVEKLEIYPTEIAWLCIDCAKSVGSSIPLHHMPTWHLGICFVCKQEKVVTEPRDYYPRPEPLLKLAGKI